jgi:S-(hydroxymethyl)glutathione dehydrogenase/alcohol dehydrogenase
MRAALECAHKGWGESIIIGVAPAGAEISTRPFQLVTGPVLARHGLRRRAGRTDVPKIVDWYMDGKIEIDPMITHTMPLEDINKGFDLMHSGESIRSVVTRSIPISTVPERCAYWAGGKKVFVVDTQWRTPGHLLHRS